MIDPQIRQALVTNPAARPGRKLTKVKGIVLHWVANPGTSAMANRNYFENGVSDAKQNWASAHYLVDPNEIVQAIPDDEMAYHVGATSYNPEMLRKFQTSYPNDCLIGIEMCHMDWEGNYDPRTWALSVKLVASLCIKYDLTTAEVVRHYDITYKECPRLMVRSQQVFENFKAEVQRVIDQEATDRRAVFDKVVLINTGTLNVRSGPGIGFPIIGVVYHGEKYPANEQVGEWVKIKRPVGDGYISASYVKLEDGPTPVEEAPVWAKEYTDLAIKHGIMTGYGDGRYGFDDPVTRAQAAVMIMKVARLIVRLLGKDGVIS